MPASAEGCYSVGVGEIKSQTEREGKNREVPSQTSRIGWLTAMLALTASTVGLVLHYRGRHEPTNSAAGEPMAAGSRVAADELEQLKIAVRALDRKSTALELKLAAAQAELAASHVAPTSPSTEANA